MTHLSYLTASAQPTAPTSPEPAAAPVSPEAAKPLVPLTSEERQNRQQWRKEMSAVPLPKKGCFTAVYPSKEWQEVQCVPAPNYPQPPRHGARPLIVGNANDVSAQTPSGFISQATGSFVTVSGVKNEMGPIANSGPAVDNAYTLQLNTNYLPGSVSCAGAPNPDCQGWQQFVFENYGSGGRVYIQYWLLQYNTTCPAGQNWNQFSFTGSSDIYCWKNDSMGATPVPTEPISNLANLSLEGKVSTNGDNATLTDLSSGTMYPVPGDNAVNASNGWNIAEFNVFGDGGNSSGGGQAAFNSGSTIVPRTEIIYGGTSLLVPGLAYGQNPSASFTDQVVPADGPVCSAEGFTGETNNLKFGPSAPTPSPPGPAILFTESSAGGAPSNCAAAISVGDTHLTTFIGLH